MTTTTTTTTVIDLASIVLKKGDHNSFAEGVCLLELVSFMAGETFSDTPQCVSPVIAGFGREWNDSLSDEDRQSLKPLAPLMIGTVSNDADEETRAWMATDWFVRTSTAAWLETAGITEHANALKSLAPITDDESARAAVPILDAVRLAAQSAARSAADSAVDAAAQSAVNAVAQSEVWAAVWSMAQSVTQSVTQSVARSAARSAAFLAAEDALQPTVKVLQESALGLMVRMCAVGRSETGMEVAK